MNSAIFREYDIRGIVKTDLPLDVVELIGKGFGTYVKRYGAKVVAVGCDVRLTSLELKSAIISGITSTGVNVIDVGVVPTPVLYFSISHFGTDGGLMITGSHNPIEYNGFFYQRIAQITSHMLRKDGAVFVEMGYKQKDEIKSIFLNHGFTDLTTRRDLAGIDRVLCARSQRTRP